ncbi:MAG TPA: acetolactate synthase large subunit [Candidatus Binataceae bacterium]|jgi:acetolactate synthase-1/2/3 large subunit|nr:acetolactate synthase large subunit [Candidatus Binataceae bacterium]
MNGAEILIRTALAAGVNVCFANPGTTEMPLVAALDAADGMRAVLGLFEGVCSGAADGYARMADRPALTLTHLGPGFANSIANLHNARRARSPVVNIIGDHATWHLASDAPLTSDIASLAQPVSAWVRKSASPDAIAGDTADAIAAAGHAPGHVATLIVPSDCQWSTASDHLAPPQIAALPTVGDAAVRASAELLRKHGAKAVLFMGANALRARGLAAAARIAAKTGCRLMCETFPARVERGGALPAIEKLPYFPEQALESLGKSDAVVLAGAPVPVAFFGYPNVPSVMIPEGRERATLAAPYDDAAAALEALAEALEAPRASGAAPAVKRPPLPTGELNAATIGAAIAATMPEHAIVMDEAATTGLPFFGASAGAPAHTYLALTGGAIGQGLPCATGAAVACPDRKVIAFQADGSGMYTLQSLWTQAREQLNVVTLICNNRRYRILQVELARAGVTEPGPKARSLTSLANPELDWSRLAAGMGVPAVRVERSEELVTQLQRALAEPGPNLIEMLI